MKVYEVYGVQSLLNAAEAECVRAQHMKRLPAAAGDSPTGFLRIEGNGFFRSRQVFPDDYEQLHLPADWDKLMGILDELKKSKLPEYVRAEIFGEGFKVFKFADANKNGTWNLLNVYGNEINCWNPQVCAPITEQEFIEGGLKELAAAGYVKGANYDIQAKVIHHKVSLTEVEYMTARKCSSDSVNAEIERTGFCFVIRGGMLASPPSICALIPTVPTTSLGIPYRHTGNSVRLGDGTPGIVGGEKSLNLNVGVLRYLLKQGATELVTKAGRLTQADLELLTK